MLSALSSAGKQELHISQRQGAAHEQEGRYYKPSPNVAKLTPMNILSLPKLKHNKGTHNCECTVHQKAFETYLNVLCILLSRHLVAPGSHHGAKNAALYPVARVQPGNLTKNRCSCGVLLHAGSFLIFRPLLPMSV